MEFAPLTIDQIERENETQELQKQLEAYLYGYLSNRDWSVVLPTKDIDASANMYKRRSIILAWDVTRTESQAEPPVEQVKAVLDQTFANIQAEYALDADDSSVRMIAENPFTLENIQEVVQ